jgi:molecular chaperone GrpE
MLRDQTAHLERATAGLIEQLLPVLDSFELALNSGGPVDSKEGAERLRKGVELVYGELLGVLEKAGLERIEAHGKPFDPEEHEAVMHVESGDGEPGVRDVVRSGYRLKGRVLRPAMVKVAT